MKKGIAKICHCRGHMRVSTGNPGLKKDVLENKVILKGCYSGSQPYTKQSGWDAEYRPFGMTLLNRGFTLIELLVVVLIVGILSAVALPQYQKAVRRARAAEYQVWVKRIIDAEKEYYMANGRYTGNIEKLNLDYKSKWPDAYGRSYGNGELTTADGPVRLDMWDYNGYIFRVMVTEPIKKYGDKVGGYGAGLHAKDALQNYSLVCAEYACHGVPPGSFCKDVLGVQGSPVVDGAYCFRFYQLP